MIFATAGKLTQKLLAHRPIFLSLTASHRLRPRISDPGGRTGLLRTFNVRSDTVLAIGANPLPGKRHR
jgi:hypothetical protein